MYSPKNQGAKRCDLPGAPWEHLHRLQVDQATEAVELNGPDQAAWEARHFQGALAPEDSPQDPIPGDIK